VEGHDVVIVILGPFVQGLLVGSLREAIQAKQLILGLPDVLDLNGTLRSRPALQDRELCDITGRGRRPN
jgi:hypothetical protein